MKHLQCTVLLLCLVASTTQAQSPESTPAEISPKDREFFEKQIRPLLIEHCYECHTVDDPSGSLALDSAQGLLTGGDLGPAIVVGSADKSLLIEAIRYTNVDLQMPPKGRLPQAAIDLLSQWIDGGAPDPRSAPGPASQTQTKPNRLTREAAADFWSFRPVSRPDFPPVKNADWIQSPIDFFILAQLENAGLTPAPPADRRTLIRRVTEDLTGLPPSADEVNDFLADRSPDAFARVVDRLLASPQYGVRWGRHWLDVARYADSNGLDENLAYGNAWRYRDYVVDAWNADWPFDRFALEQLAGDLLPDSQRRTLTATGFLALGARVLAERDEEKLLMDTVDEQIDTVGKVFMAMSLGCVRCHDHKFDPFTQSDYYALAAVFKSTRSFAHTNTGAIRHWYEHSFATDQELEQLKEVDQAIKAAQSKASAFKNAAVAQIRKDAQSKAAEYLAAAVDVSPGESLADIAPIAERHRLHARLLYQCRSHIEHQREHPFYAAWHRLAPDREAVLAHYSDLFGKVDAAWQAAIAANPQTRSLGDPILEQARQQRLDPAGFLAVPDQVQWVFDSQTLAQYDALEEAARLLESNAPDETAALGVCDGPVLQQLPIHIRGSHLNLGQPVAREFPVVLRTSSVRPIFPAGQSGRLELARWLTSTTHPLTARVMVNRIWGWHFGAPIVRTTENFGYLGGRPSHPELLDWLAYEWMQNAWSVKHLHRIMLLSSTYQMDSQHPDHANGYARDASNRLLWKFNLQRFDAEQLRDAVLATSGRLDMRIGGKTVPLRNRQFVFNHTSQDHTKYDSLRRTIYLPVIRNHLYSLLEQFDFPDPTMPTGHRSVTTVAPQALVVMNSDLFVQAAEDLAGQILKRYPQSPEQALQGLYMTLFARQPNDGELENCHRILDSQLRGHWVNAIDGEPSAQLRAWTLLCHGLMATNEFAYVK